MDDQDPRAAEQQRPRCMKLTQVVTHNERPSTFWEFLLTGRSTHKSATYSIVPMWR